MGSKTKKGNKVESFWTPLLARADQERYADGGKVRLIGLELRMRDPMGRQEEIQMIPLNIEIPGVMNPNYAWEFGPHTLHTSVGDVNIPAQQLIRGAGL